MIPNGRVLNWYLSKGVMNAVQWRNSLAKGICQKPLFAFSLVKICVSKSWANVPLIAGSGWNSPITFSFKGFMLTHILTFPEGFGTTTMPAHHGDGSFIQDITPGNSIWLSSFCTSFHIKIGTRLAACNAHGLASGFNGILYSSFRVPRPEKTFEYC